MSLQIIPLKGRTDFAGSSRILATDYSPLSCGGGETQLGPSAIAKGFLARMLVNG
jgi:hypothetical protein